MRKRLVAALVGLTAIVLVLYGAPRFLLLTNLLHSQEQHLIDRSADLLAGLVTEQVRAGTPITATGLGQALEAGDRIVYVSAGGVRVEATGPGDGADGPPAGTAAGSTTAHRLLPGAGEIVLVGSEARLRAQVRALLPPILVTGLLLLGVAALAGWWLAERLAHPFRALAASARQIGAGHLEVPVPHSRVPEAEAIGEALRAGTRQFAAALAHERHFADTASHELRTPLTALRLDLEDLTHWPETPPTVAAHLRQSLVEIDRLSGAIRGQLDRSRQHRMDEAKDFDLAMVVTDAVTTWRPRAAAAGLDLVLVEGGPVAVRLPITAVVQAVDALLGHLLEDGLTAVGPSNAHRGPNARINMRALDLGSHARVELTGLTRATVTQESPRESAATQQGIAAAAESPGTHLARARELASFAGGQLVGGGPHDAHVGLLLPTIEPEL